MESSNFSITGDNLNFVFNESGSSTAANGSPVQNSAKEGSVNSIAPSISMVVLIFIVLVAMFYLIRRFLKHRKRKAV